MYKHWGSEVVVFSPNRGRAMDVYCRKTLCGTGDHGARRGSCLGRRPDLAEIALASLWLQWASWRLLWRVLSSRRDVAERRGSCRWGLAPVKVRTAFEGRAHAVRGFHNRESMRSR